MPSPKYLLALDAFPRVSINPNSAEFFLSAGPARRPPPFFIFSFLRLTSLFFFSPPGFGWARISSPAFGRLRRCGERWERDQTAERSGRGAGFGHQLARCGGGGLWSCGELSGLWGGLRVGDGSVLCFGGGGSSWPFLFWGSVRPLVWWLLGSCFFLKDANDLEGPNGSCIFIRHHGRYPPIWTFRSKRTRTHFK